MSFDRQRLKQLSADLAIEGILVGTSSWKYPGWCGQIYEPQRYEWRGKFAKSRFEKNCLNEYAEVFKTVCVDAAYYTFPSEASLRGLVAQVPADFQFGFKVTHTITIKKFPNHARHGKHAGLVNEFFLDANAFERGFLRPCETIRSQVGVLIFEFSRFHSTDYAHGKDFVADLDRFLGNLPRGWPYGVEMRNHQWLQTEYFECLARHNVTHVYNSWTEMPPIAEQMALSGSRTNPNLVAARFLLKPGRKYEEAVRAFAPYGETKETNAEARAAGSALIANGKKNPKGRTFLFINNRLEGNALNTIKAILEASVRGDVNNPPLT